MFDRQQSIRRARAVDISTTDDTMPPNSPTRTIYVGTGGTLIVELTDNQGTQVSYSVVSGSRHVLSVSKVVKTGTTASGIIAEF